MKRMRTVLAVFLTLTLLLSMFCQPLEAAGINLAVGGKSGTGTSIVMPTAGLLQGLTGLMGKLGGGSGIATIAGSGGTARIATSDQIADYLNKPNVTWDITCKDDASRDAAHKHEYHGNGLGKTFYFCDNCTIKLNLDWPAIPDGIIVDEDPSTPDIIDFVIPVDLPVTGTIGNLGATLEGYGEVKYEVNSEGKGQFHFYLDKSFNTSTSRNFGINFEASPDPLKDKWEKEHDNNLEIGKQKYEFEWKEHNSSLSGDKKIVNSYVRDGKLYIEYLLDYTLTGDGTDIVITDTYGSNLTLEDSNFTVTPTGYTLDKSSVPNQFTITYPSLKDGTNIQARYTCSVPVSSLGDFSDYPNQYNGGSFDVSTINNKVVVTGKGEEGNDLNVEQTVTPDRPAVRDFYKTGSVKYYDASGTEVNENNFFGNPPTKAVITYTVNLNLKSYIPFVENYREDMTLGEFLAAAGLTYNDVLTLPGGGGTVDLTDEAFKRAVESAINSATHVPGEEGKFSFSYDYTVNNPTLDSQVSYSNRFTVKNGKHDTYVEGSGTVGKNNWSFLTNKSIEKADGKDVSADNKIKWVVEGCLPFDLKNSKSYTIKDTLTAVNGKNKLDKDSFEYYYAQSYDQNGSPVWVKFADETAFKSAYHANVTKTDEGFTITFNTSEIVIGQNNCSYKFKIVYKSDVSVTNSGENAQFKNEAEADNVTKSAETTVTPEGEFSPSKSVVKNDDGTLTWTIDTGYPVIEFVLKNDKLLKVLKNDYQLTVTDNLPDSLEYVPGSAKIGFATVNSNWWPYTSCPKELEGGAVQELDKLFAAIQANLIEPANTKSLVFTWNMTTDIANLIDNLTLSMGNYYAQNQNEGQDHLVLKFDTKLTRSAALENMDKSFEIKNKAIVNVNSTAAETNESSAWVQPTNVLDKKLLYAYESFDSDKEDPDTAPYLLNGNLWDETHGYATKSPYTKVKFFDHKNDYWGAYNHNLVQIQRFLFIVDVNPMKLSLGENGKVTVTDTMGPAFSLYAPSVRLLKVERDQYGNLSSDASTENATSLLTFETVKNEDGTEVTTFTMPDSEHYLLVYFADADVEELTGDKFNAKDACNEIKISIDGKDYESGETYGGKLVSMSAYIGASDDFTFLIEKKNESGKPLAGVQFTAQAVEIKDGKIVDDSEKKPIVSSVSSGDDGNIAFSDKSNPLKQGTVYRVYESLKPDEYEQAPDYYIIHINNPDREQYAPLLGTTEDALNKGIVTTTYNGKTVKVVLVKGISKTIEIRNVLAKTVDLTVTKKVNGASGDNTKFRFTVQLSGKATGTYNYTISGKNTGSGEIKGSGTFELADGDSLKITGLPKGTTYTVTETPGDDYTSNKSDNTVSGALDESDTVEFTNTRNKGSLSVTKTVAGDITNKNADSFTFKVKLDPPTGYTLNGSYVDGDKTATLSGDFYTVTLKNGEKFTFKDLPVGTGYEVYEEDGGTKLGEGAVTSKNYKVGYSGKTGEVSKDGSTVTVTNTKNVTSLILAKNVVGALSSDEKSFKFTVTLTAPENYNLNDVTFTQGKAVKTGDGTYTVTLGNGETCTFENLPEDTTYTISETSDTANYEVKVEDSNNAAEISGKSVSGTANGNTVTYTNTRKTGGFSVTKKVTGVGADTDKEFTFTVTLDNYTGKKYLDDGVEMTYTGPFTFTLTHGDTKTFSGIPTGVGYTVEEEDYTAQNYTSTGKITDSVKDKIVAHTVTNTYTKPGTGSVSVTKKVDGGVDSEKNREFTFTIKLTPAGMSADALNKAIQVTNGSPAVDVNSDTVIVTGTVKDGETVTVSDIPYGTGYDISETQLGDFEAPEFSQNKSGKITKAAPTVTLTCTNTLKKGSLKVTKTVINNDNAGQFDFTVKLTDPSGKAITGEHNGVTFDNNGEGQFKLSDGEYKEFTDLEPGTTYTVTEADAEGYTSVITGNDGKIEPGTVKEVNVTNTKKEEKVGKLTVKKIVKINGEVKSTSEPFTVKVTTDPAVKDGEYGGMTFKNGEATLTLSAGQSATATGLPAGTKYTVVETNGADYVASYSGSTADGTGTIAKDSTATVTITNSKSELGNLTVEKIVKINGEVKSTSEPFTVKVTTDPAVKDGEYGGMTFKNGEATLTLSAGQSATATGLPAGTKYTVVETNGADYVASYSGSTADGKGTIAKDSTATVTITNSKSELGNLTVEKIVKINGEEKLTNEPFTITVTLSDDTVNGTFGEMTFTSGVASFELKSGDSKTATVLPAGITYTVVETNSAGYVASYSGSTADGKGTIAKDSTATVTITNSKSELGNLTVQKTVTGNNADETKSFDIDIQLSEPITGTYGDMNFTNGLATVYLTTRQAATAAGLPADLGFTVTERDYSAEGYVATYTYNGNTSTAPVQGTITEGGTASVYITNTKDTFGSLTLTKHVAGENPDLTKAFTFSVKLTAPTGENIIPPGYIADAQGYFTVNLTADKSVTFDNLPVGTSYIIMENDYSAEGYTGTVTEGTSDGVIVEGANQVAYTNTKAATTSLMIRKELSDTAITQADAEMLFTFHVALTAPALGEQLKPSYEYGGKTATVDATGVYVVTLKGGEGFVFMNLPDGTTYTVTEVEANQNGFTTVIPDNASGALDTNSCPIVTFVNSKELRETSLTVRKTVQGDDADYSKAFNFTVTLEGYTGPYTLNGVEAVTDNGIITFSLMSGQSATVAGIPENTVYSVTELEANADGYVTNVNGSQNGVLTPDTESSVEFVNSKWKETPKTGSLTVRKTVAGTAAEYGRRFSFTVMLSDTSVTGIYGQMNFVGGVASFALAHGESITATDLPAGITYTIFENDAGDYIQNSMGATGMITENGFAEAMFINTKDKEEKYGDLSVTKTVTGEGYDPAQQFNFTVTLSDSSVNGQYGDMNFVGGVASFTLTAGQTAYAAQLPADIFYTVTEEPTENYISTATGDTGAIVGDSMVYAEFVNEYVAPRVGGFNITKLVTGTAGDLNRFFTFRVVLSDASINGVYGDIAFADGFATVFLRSGMTVYCDGLPEGTGYSVIELDSDDYMVTYTNAAGTVEVGTSIPVTVINHKDIPEIPEEHEEDQPNPHDDDMNAGVGGDRPHGDDMNAGVGGNRPHGDDMNPATGDFELEHYSNAFITITVLWAMVFIFGAVVLADKRRRDK